MNSVMQLVLHSDIAANIFKSKVNEWLREHYSGWFSSFHKFNFEIKSKNKKFYIDSNQWEVYGNSSESWIAINADLNIKNKIISELFELDATHSIKSTPFIDAIYDDFIKSNFSSLLNLVNIDSLLNIDQKDVNTKLGSGSISGIISNGSVSFSISFGGDIVKAISGEEIVAIKTSKPSSDLVPREGTFDLLISEIEVLAGKVKMSISDFTKIEVGDIVLLNSLLGDTFPMTSSNNIVAQVQLGRLANKKAIQIIEREYERSK